MYKKKRKADSLWDRLRPEADGSWYMLSDLFLVALWGQMQKRPERLQPWETIIMRSEPMKTIVKEKWKGYDS